MLILILKARNNDIDMYLQSLINELNDLWEHGALTYGALIKENIQLHATILLTINDLPAYGNLSEWATYETLTYLVCQMYI